ncbi:MAG TPA: molybdopterin dinucleotide-binding protein [Firmicutes bacterium]|nr:molybdopterin dinucleotide-binding protein [Bacillota bacterium]
MKVEVILITGRTINQGRGLMQGKESGLYRKETAVVELGAAVLEQLGLQAGDLVRVGTAFGEGIFSCRLADLPHNLAFVPYGPEANRLTDARTNGSGMPGYKGLQAWVGRDSSGCS